jgi:hypothetical protein
MANITSFVYQLVIYRQEDTHAMCRNLLFTTAVGLIKELDKFISPDYPKDKRPTDVSLTKLRTKYVLDLRDENFIFEIRKLEFHPSKTGLIDFFNNYSVVRPLFR